MHFNCGLNAINCIQKKNFGMQLLCIFILILMQLFIYSN